MSAPPCAEEHVPYGILESDVAYEVTIDGCSRCNRPIAPADEPVVLWPHGGKQLWVFCSVCAGSDGFERRAN